MLTSFSDPALVEAAPVDPTLEPLVASIEAELHALGEALRDGDARSIEVHSQALQRTLATAVQSFGHAARQPGGIPPALRKRLVAAGGVIAAQRESLARATSTLDRAIDMLMPGEPDHENYTAGGRLARPASGAATDA